MPGRPILVRSVPVYRVPNRSNLVWTAKHSGAYIIKERKRGAKRFTNVYVGHSAGDLYATIIRHFGVWNDKSARKPRVTYVDHLGYREYKVQVLFTTAADCYKWESYLIDKLKPRDNTQQQEAYLPTAAEAARFAQSWEDGTEISRTEFATIEPDNIPF
jgi:hypothetical protein